MKKTRTNKNHNTNKKIKTAAIATLTTLSLGFAGVTTAIYLQPSHYKGDTFTNAKTSISSTSSTSTSSSSSSDLSTSSNDSDTNIYNTYTEYNSAEVTNNNSSNQVNNNQSQETNNSTTTQIEQRGGTCMGQTSGDRAYQPTFKVECVSTKNGLYCVEHIPTGDKTKAIPYEQAESFCTYMEQIAYGKTSLSHTMDENYNSWSGNTEQAQSSETNEE